MIVEITNIDTEEPNGNASYSPNVATNQSVTVTITTNKQVNTPSGWTYVTTQEFTKVYTENWTGEIGITDFVGNTGEVNVSVTNIDKTPPVVGTVTAGTNSVTFNATDQGLGINAYAVTISSTAPTSGWTNISATLSLGNTTVSGLAANTTYYVWVRDVAGNVNVARAIATGCAHSWGGWYFEVADIFYHHQMCDICGAKNSENHNYQLQVVGRRPYAMYVCYLWTCVVGKGR